MTRDNEDIFDALRGLLEGLAATTDSDASEILGRYVELERSLLTHYQELLKESIADQSTTRVTQSLTKLVMTAFVETAAFQRDTQQKLLESQSRFADSYLGFLNQVSEEISKRQGASTESTEPPETGGESTNETPDGAPKKAAK